VPQRHTLSVNDKFFGNSLGSFEDFYQRFFSQQKYQGVNKRTFCKLNFMEKD